MKAARSGHTRVQVECPHIIQEFPVDLTPKNEELGTNHCHGVAIATDRAGTINHHAGPLSRDYSAIHTCQLGAVSGTNKGRTKIKEIERVILPLIRHYLGTSIGVTSPNQNDTTDEGTHMANTWARDLTTCLLKSS